MRPVEALGAAVQSAEAWRRYAELLQRYGRAILGDAWWPGNDGVSGTDDAQELEALVDRLDDADQLEDAKRVLAGLHPDEETVPPGLAEADAAYQETTDGGLPASYEQALRHEHGDLLADFIVVELHEAGGIAEAAASLGRCALDLERVADALDGLAPGPAPRGAGVARGDN